MSANSTNESVAIPQIVGEWLSSFEAGDYLDAVAIAVAILAAIYTAKQKNVAVKALDAAQDANRIALQAQQSALDLAKKTAEVTDNLQSYNSDFANSGRSMMLQLSEFPAKIRSDVEHQNFQKTVFDAEWKALRDVMGGVRSRMRQQMMSGSIDSITYQNCFTSTLYDELVGAADDISSLPNEGITGRIEILAGCVERFNFNMQAAIQSGVGNITGRIV